MNEREPELQAHVHLFTSLQPRTKSAAIFRSDLDFVQ
jgi:hypothetical protein